MTQEDYLARLLAEPLLFPFVDEYVPSAERVAAAWNIEAIREANIADWQREVSKTGEMNCPDETLRLIATVRYALSELYERLLEAAPHREAEFRVAFLRVVSEKELPKPLSRLRLVRLLGTEAAQSLLAEEYPDDQERYRVLHLLPWLCERFNAVDPPGFDPPTDDEYDDAVEHVAAGVEGCGTREEVRALIRAAFEPHWKYWAPWPPSEEAVRRFDQLADEVWHEWRNQ